MLTTSRKIISANGDNSETYVDVYTKVSNKVIED
ncbi:TPA: DUF6275 family protein [Streptococcus agalactiae]